MLYTLETNRDGIHFYPIREDNVYVLCKCCHRFVQIHDPAGAIAEIGSIGVTIEAFDKCDECIDKECEEEDESMEHTNDE